MRLFSLTLGLVFVMMSCGNDESEAMQNGKTDTHKAEVKEVLQTGNYTYLFVTENKSDMWLAVSKREAKVGDVYYYEGGMLMENFESKELSRTFEKIWFLDAIRTTPEAPAMGSSTAAPHNMKPKVEKQDIKIETVEGGITIAELFANPSKYEGKTVKIKGKVAKFNPEIMGKNWIHIQDGTDHKGEFDLTLTSQQVVKIDDTIVAEGKIALNKDFGAGYVYTIIMEDAVVK